MLGAIDIDKKEHVPMPSSKPVKFAVGGLAAVVLALGAYAIGDSNSGNGTAVAAQSGQAPAVGQAPPGAQASHSGRMPPGCGTTATGAAADKAKAAALAKYKGSVERVVKLPDGSYVVHVITSKGEYHVHVSKDFKVTGADQGGPGRGGPPPAP